MLAVIIVVHFFEINFNLEEKKKMKLLCTCIYEILLNKKINKKKRIKILLKLSKVRVKMGG